MSQLVNDDCYRALPLIPDKSIDCIITDPPFNKIRSNWDIPIDLNQLWAEYKRIIKDNGAILIFGVQPFSSMVISANPKWYKYQWIWRKSQAGNFAVAKYMPLSVCEDILVFGREKINYYPQMEEREKPRYVGGKNSTKNGQGFGGLDNIYKLSTHKFPINLLEYPVVERRKSLHPSQKPEELIKYLIRTYTVEGNLILDTFAGSGTTALAAHDLGRQYIAIEQDVTYYNIMVNRLNERGNYYVRHSR